VDIIGKTVLLTGATGGIGRAFASALSDAGARLIVVARSNQELQELTSTLAGTGHIGIAADLSTASGRQQLINTCNNDVDILINNAGINHFAMLEEHTEEDLGRLFELNVLAPMVLVKGLLDSMRERPSAIVNVGSGFGSIGFAGFSGYSASKFALRGFTEALRRELAGSSVQVMYLAPRATATTMNSDTVVAMNRELGNTVDEPATVAKELLALLATQQRTRYIGWPERFFIFLNSVFPTVVDRALSKQLPIIRRHSLAKLVNNDQ